MFSDVTEDEAGVYHCEATFQSDFTISAETAIGISSTRLNILRITREPAKTLFITPGYQGILRAEMFLPVSLPVPVLYWKSSDPRYPVIDQNSSLVAGERFSQNGAPFYSSVLTTPLPSPAEYTLIFIEVHYQNVSAFEPIQSAIKTQIKTRKVIISAVSLSQVTFYFYILFLA